MKNIIVVILLIVVILVAVTILKDNITRVPAPRVICTIDAVIPIYTGIESWDCKTSVIASNQVEKIYYDYSYDGNTHKFKFQTLKIH